MIELNIDGLVGPTHHYGGLSAGNIASTTHAFERSNPAKAALQGLSKIRLLHQLGVKQAIFPPHFRPNFNFLKKIGFEGTPEQQIKKVVTQAPELLSLIFSASSMWTANMATVTPSIDSNDGRVHFSPANLITHAHRQQEACFTFGLLQHFFNDSNHFAHHPPLPGSLAFSDEGAANHNRLCEHHHTPGLHLFIYGKTPKHFPARQAKMASEAIARRHGLTKKNAFFIQQNPAAIDAGVFHHDVIGVTNESVMLIHEEAWVDQKNWIQKIKAKVDYPIHIIEIPSQRLSLKDAVETYLFNSQLITLQNNPKEMFLLAPQECQDNKMVYAILMEMLQQDHHPIKKISFIELKESMHNGGGPACLRLRVPLTEAEYQAVHPGILVTDKMLVQLEQWINRHYRTTLYPADLADPFLFNEIKTALDELTHLLNLGDIYQFNDA